ncbi:MAG: hypothetical protein JWQ81_1412 [Amycolatopsis sp.]|nr:hypothetical protein [Amycolatopsis sp.]
MGPAAGEDDSDGDTVGDMVGNLRQRGQRADAGEPSADDSEVERGDDQSGGRSGRDSVPLRQSAGEDSSPAEGKRDVRHGGGREQWQRA